VTSLKQYYPILWALKISPERADARARGL